MRCVWKGSSVEGEDEQQPAVEEGKEKEKAENQPEPLWQLITAFSRSATTEATFVLEADFLYISYATIMGQVSIAVSQRIRIHHHHHHLFAQSTSNSHIQQCNIVEQDSKVQERTLTAARKRSMI